MHRRARGARLRFVAWISPPTVDATITVYGVIRLYTDLVALTEDEKVKQETVALAEKLLTDVRAQVEEGTLAQVEMTRANARFSPRART